MGTRKHHDVGFIIIGVFKLVKGGLLLIEVGLVQQRDLALVVTTSLFYSALLSTEGVGLLMEKVWAEYLTSIITTSFIPIEIYALTRHTTVLRVCLLLANVLVVAYLVFRLGQRKHPGASPTS